MNSYASTFQSLTLERQLMAAEGWLGLGDYESADSEMKLIPEEYRKDLRYVLLAVKIREARQSTPSALIDHPAELIAPALLALWVKQAYCLQASTSQLSALHFQTLV